MSTRTILPVPFSHMTTSLATLSRGSLVLQLGPQWNARPSARRYLAGVIGPNRFPLTTASLFICSPARVFPLSACRHLIRAVVRRRLPTGRILDMNTVHPQLTVRTRPTHPLPIPDPIGNSRLWCTHPSFRCNGRSIRTRVLRESCDVNPVGSIPFYQLAGPAKQRAEFASEDAEACGGQAGLYEDVAGLGAAGAVAA